MMYLSLSHLKITVFFFWDRLWVRPCIRQTCERLFYQIHMPDSKDRNFFDGSLFITSLMCNSYFLSYHLKKMYCGKDTHCTRHFHVQDPLILITYFYYIAEDAAFTWVDNLPMFTLLINYGNHICLTPIFIILSLCHYGTSVLK